MKRWLVPAMFACLVVTCVAAAGSGADSASLWLWMALILPVSAWFLVEGQRASRMWFVAVVLIASIAAVSAAPFIITAVGGMSGEGQQFGLKKFSSYEELVNFVRMNVDNYSSYYGSSWQSVPVAPSGGMPFLADGVALESRGKSDFSFTIRGDDFHITIDDDTIDISTDHSTTNIQVEGVDEADIVKCDGKYIYVVSGNKVIIIDAYPAENARILSEIEENGNPREIFINGDKLVLLGLKFVKVYDVSDRENPVLVKDVSFDGWYFNSRMVGNYVYVVINSPTIYYWAQKIDLPTISFNGNVRTIQATEIYYFENLHYYSYEFVTIMAINTQNDDEEITSETFLISTAQNLFVSSSNIYITYRNYYNWIWNTTSDQTTEKTIIHKISIADGEIKYKCWGEVPGRILNQFSMDEYQGYFRVATTTGWGNEAKNHVYTLDGNLAIVGRLEGIAPTERIYSARFMGGRAYLVTFRRVDPLFVLDLSNPRDPKVLGELKIPGYSDYLHPYDETHLIGVGRDTGVKIALFDVSDPENPEEMSKYEVGGWGTDSYALRDHRAFLFSRPKNLLVIPISDWQPRRSDTRYGWRGAYVFSVSLDNGIVLKGNITHQEDNVTTWGSYYNRSVKRSLYIDNVLYTISDGLVKMNNLEDLGKVNSIELPTSVKIPPISIRPMIG